jgi:hypothetical protein
MSLILLVSRGGSDYSRTWETTYGRMVLTQDGGEVSGFYSYGGVSSIAAPWSPRAGWCSPTPSGTQRGRAGSNWKCYVIRECGGPGGNPNGPPGRAAGWVPKPGAGAGLFWRSEWE